MRSDVCCGGPDNSGTDSGTDPVTVTSSDSGIGNTEDDTLVDNSTESTDVTTAMDNNESSSGQINISMFSLLLFKLL